MNNNTMNELVEIQTKLKAPKNMYNSFGKYNYRNLEGILEAVKPLLAETKCKLILSDEVRAIGGEGDTRFYVIATATLYNSSGESAKVTAWAREPESKKGMDESQITGTASSYARKYAVNGLFLIDDSKDADTDEYHNEVEAHKLPAWADLKTPESIKTEISRLLGATETDETVFLAYLGKKFKHEVSSIEDMSDGELGIALVEIRNKAEKKGVR